MVGLLSVVLVGISAFTIDFGMSYVNQRELQTASDAAALTAASVYGYSGSGSCSARAADSGLRATAETAADAVRAQNRPGATGSITNVTCTADNKGVLVTYSSSGSTPTFVGGVFGHSGNYGGTHVATAAVGAPKSAIGVRPYALCAGQLPTTFPSPVFQMSLPSSGNSICPGASTSGNWWEVDCPEAPSNSNSYLGTATQNGCTSEITVVPNQAPRTGAALRTYLTGYCPAKSNSCLGANTGNLGGTPIINAWDSLVNQHARVIFPVFCGSPPCDQGAVVNGGGNNAIYPVQSLIGVIVCGYHFGNKDSGGIAMTGDCGGLNNPSNYIASAGSNQDNYLLLRAIAIETSGGSSDFGCALGDTCDQHSYAVHLTQ